MLRRGLKWAAASLAAIVLACLSYAMAALLGALIPVNAGFQEPEDGIPVYLASNGVHVDILLPMQSGVVDWRALLPMEDFGPSGREANYIAFGWGDRTVFIDTPTWRDLKASTALKALLGLNGAVMHVEPRFIPDPTAPLPGGVVRLRLSAAQLKSLSRYVEAGFERDASGGVAGRIAGASYWGTDVFYPATGRYSPLLTCNDWLRRGLAGAGVRTLLWSPFAAPILYQVRRAAAGS